MRKFRILALVLAIIMVAALSAGCGKKEPADTSETTPTTQTTTTETTTEATTTTALSFNDYLFSFMGSTHPRCRMWYAEPANADQQQMMDYLHEIEDTYDVIFEELACPTGDALLTAGMSGTDLCDFMFLQTTDWGRFMLAGYTRQLDTDEVRATGLDVLNEEQVDINTVNAAKIAGKVHYFRFTCKEIPAQLGRLFAMNPALVAGVGYPMETIYQAVRDNEWTWDVMLDICHAGAVLNQETGTYDICGISKIFVYPEINTMCKGMIYYDEATKKYVSGITDVSFVSSLNTVVNRIIMDPSVMYTDMAKGVGNGYGNEASRQWFYAGHALFGTFDNFVDDLYPNANFAYGIIPFPRGSSATSYVTTLQTIGGFVLPSANQDWQTSCQIMALIGDLINDIQAGIDVYAELTHDAESLEMLGEYILPNMKAEYITFSATTESLFWTGLRGAVMGGTPAQAAIEAVKNEFSAAVAEAFKLFNK